MGGDPRRPHVQHQNRSLLQKLLFISSPRFFPTPQTNPPIKNKQRYNIIMIKSKPAGLHSNTTKQVERQQRYCRCPTRDCAPSATTLLSGGRSSGSTNPSLLPGDGIINYY